MNSSTNARAILAEACDSTRLSYMTSAESNHVKETKATRTSDTSPSTRDPGSDFLVPNKSQIMATSTTDSRDRSFREADIRCERKIPTHLNYSMEWWLAQPLTEDHWTVMILPQRNDVDSKKVWMDWQLFDTPTQSTDSQYEITGALSDHINVGVNRESDYGPGGDA